MVFTFKLPSIGIPELKTKDFIKWAFGSDSRFMPIKEAIEYWNENHSDLFVADTRFDLQEQINRMAEYYKKEFFVK